MMPILERRESRIKRRAHDASLLLRLTLRRWGTTTVLRVVALVQGIWIFCMLTMYRNMAASTRADPITDPSTLLPPHGHVVKVIAVPSRRVQAKQNLRHWFPDLELVDAVDLHGLDLVDMEQHGTLDRSWDATETKIHRQAYCIDYPQAGEVACLLSHRKALQQFLHSASSETMLVLEDDAVPLHDNGMSDVRYELRRILKEAPPDWHYINLGRCLDVCHNWVQQVHRTPVQYSKIGRLYGSRGWELCTHSYLVSREGANILLQHTMPMILPYDHTVNLLGRRGILNVYFTTPNYFYQSPHFTSLLRSEALSHKDICDPFVSPERVEVLQEFGHKFDQGILHRIATADLRERASQQFYRNSTQ